MSCVDFKSLLNFYRQCFELVDVFHFNSSIAQRQYENNLKMSAESVVVPITHNGITDHRKKKDFTTPVLKLGFIGAETDYKGLPLLKRVLAGLHSSKWALDVWGSRIGKDDDLSIFYRGKFDKSSIERVYNEMDLLVVPSLWKETFSLVTLEALSYGVPVLVSANVGAQDIVREYAPSFVYKTEGELECVLLQLLTDKTPLRKFNEAILKKTWNYDVKRHAQEIVEMLYCRKE